VVVVAVAHLVKVQADQAAAEMQVNIQLVVLTVLLILAVVAVHPVAMAPML
jgi:hypothetical protein